MKNKQPARILVIEDEPELRKLYADLLADQGYEVIAAGDGQSGLKLLKKGGYDLVLLDIMLPTVDGLEVLQRLIDEGTDLGAPEQPTDTIVMLTNLAQDETIAKAVEGGVRGYMVKSDYDPGQFLAAVQEFLRKD